MWLAITIVNTFLIVTIVDVILMGTFSFQFRKKCTKSEYLITKKNRIDAQKGNECSGYASAFVLRHFGIEATGEEMYQKMAHKMSQGYVYPKQVKKVLKGYGLHVKYCTGNLNGLKKEISKGNPVIAFIKVRKHKSWLHYVPVVGFDKENLFLAESMEEFVNCQEEMYNRKVGNKEFCQLWNTSMLKMPLYSHTYFIIDK